jgi:CHAT domain-containing protein
MADDKSELVASSVGREDELRSARAACPDLAAMTWAPLPNSAAEVRAVSGAWKKQYGETPTIYLGAQASEERFKAVAGTARAVHVATHGYYIDPECGWRGDPRVSPSRAEANPLLFSGILLAGANLHGRGVDEEGGEDGVLSAYEVAVLDLRSVDTVVLSGCETGLGRVEAGEGVYGLRRAFLVAGAGRVVVSLWQVPDRLTAAMMAPLHEGDGEPTYARIRTIQLHRLRELRERGASDHPVEWAAFLVVGSPE